MGSVNPGGKDDVAVAAFKTNPIEGKLSNVLEGGTALSERLQVQNS